LTALDEAELIKFLHELIVNVSLEEGGWDHYHMPALKNVIAQLVSSQATNKKDVLVDTLCDMVVHPAKQVRACVVTLFNVIVPTSKADDILRKILPALITLANDPDRVVRSGCIEPFGNIAVNIPDGMILDKLADAFDKILEDDAHGTKLEVVRTLANIIPYISLKPKFRDLYILPRLVEQARKNNYNTNTGNRCEMAQSLFDAFRLLASISLSKEVIDEQILPGLKSLLQDSHLMDSTYRTMVQFMIHDVELQLNGDKDDDKAGKRASILGKLDFPSNTPLSSLGVNIDKLTMPKWSWKKP